MEKLKVGITGASGFIGKHLTMELSKRGNINYVVFEGDLLKKSDLESFFKDNPNLNSIIHLAGIFSNSLEELLKINVQATSNLLEEMLKNKVNKIVFSSTGAVYGEPIANESIETDPRKPNTLYGVSKMYAEDIIFYYTNNFGIKHIILRFPNVYGLGNTKGVIYNFIRGIKEDKKITIYGDGSQSRNFLHVSDAVGSIIKAANYRESGIFNIADKSLYSLNDIVSILKTANIQFTVDYRDEDAANILKVLSENITRAGDRLDWHPKARVPDELLRILIS